MKKLSLLFLASLFCVTSAYSLTIADLETAGYVETQSDFFSLSDYTAPNTASFSLTFEQAAYESTFGIYTVDNMDAIASDTTAANMLQVFSLDDDPGEVSSSKSIIFTNENNVWYADNGTDKVKFGTQFGFYFGVDSDYIAETSANETHDVDYTFYTAELMNTQDSGIEHIRTFLKSNDGSFVPNDLYVLLDDQLGAYPNVVGDGRDNDWTDMQIHVNDVAPVPEPATLLLLGSGLVGLAFLKRRKS